MVKKSTPSRTLLRSLEWGGTQNPRSQRHLPQVPEAHTQLFSVYPLHVPASYLPRRRLLQAPKRPRVTPPARSVRSVPGSTRGSRARPPRQPSRWRLPRGALRCDGSRRTWRRPSGICVPRLAALARAAGAGCRQADARHAPHILQFH